MLLTIRFAGYGGYGVVTASRILGLTYTNNNYHVIQTESHGAAARGEACNADLTLSSDPIYELEVGEPDILIILSSAAFHKCCTLCSFLSRDKLLIESELLQEPDIQEVISTQTKSRGLRVFQLNLREVVNELGNVRYMGVASLGALASIDDQIDIVELERTIKTDSKLKRFAQENLHALRRGTELIKPYTS